MHLGTRIDLLFFLQTQAAGKNASNAHATGKHHRINGFPHQKSNPKGEYEEA
jgi:hypothetical protein